MTLLSPLALLVGLTALVPLALHLYQQRRRTVIEFSSNRFFTASIIRSQRRRRLRRLILLIVRMAACIFLALALARPLMALAGFGGGAGTRDVVILLDDSLSMQAGEEPGRSAASSNRFEHARALATGVLSELRAGDRAAVVTFTGRAIGDETRRGLELSEDLLRLAGEVEQLRPTFAAGDAHAALDRAAKLFGDPAPRHRLLLVLTDLQAADWRQIEWPQAAHPIPAAIVCLTPPPKNNVALDHMTLGQGNAAVGQPNLLRVRLVNYRPEAAPAELVLRVDGQERLRRPIELPGRSPHVERIPLTFEQAGEHELELHVNCRDALAADNTLYAGVRVHAKLPILLVDGRAEVERGRSAAFFLRAALRAVSEEGQGVHVETIRPADLNAASLAGYRVTILSAVRELSVTQVEQLERFVQAGGGLAIFLDESANRSFYNETLGAASRPLGGLLPAEVRGLVETGQTLEPLHVLAAELDHPALQRFKGTLRSALAGISVYRAYAVAPRDAWVLATLDEGLPLLVERSYGQGRVMLCTTAPRPRWTNLPLRRVFVPLCSRLMSHLAGGGAAAGEHYVGTDLELLRGGWDTGQPVYLRRPDGARLRAAVTVEGADPVAYVPGSEVQRPGVYRLELPPGAPAAGAARTLLAVNAPRSESSPAVLDVEHAAALAGNWRLSTIKAEDVLNGTDVAAGGTSLLTGGWLSRGVWDALLWTVFALLLVEPLLANRIGRWRRAGDDARRRRAA